MAPTRHAASRKNEFGESQCGGRRPNVLRPQMLASGALREKGLVQKIPKLENGFCETAMER